MSDPRDPLSDLLGTLDGGPGPARRLSSARTAGLVAAIADQAQAPASVQSPQPAQLPARSPRRGRIALLAAAIVMVSASIAAATGAWLTAREPVASPAISPPRSPAAPPPAAAPAAPSPAAPETPATPVPPELRTAEPAPRPPRAKPRAEAAAPVEDLLAAANWRRKEKRWRDAAALYERVIDEHAGTDAAVVATVASASLRLDRLDDAAGALRRFQRALRARPDGPLAEEARWGIAEARRALGDATAERGALRAFVAAHPRSPRLDAARRRLDELAAAVAP